MKLFSVLIAVVCLASCGARTSDEERVREVVAAMETAAEERDASDVLEHVAANYEDAQGFDRAQLTHFLRGYFLAHPKVELPVDIESVEFPADGRRGSREIQGGIPPPGKRLAAEPCRPAATLDAPHLPVSRGFPDVP